MISLVMLVILLGCAALLYLKGTLAQGLIMVLNALVGGFVAMALFESMAGMLVKYASALTAWAQTISFMLLFLLAFAVLQTVAMQVIKQKIDFGLWPERIGRVACGLVLGYIVTGQLLVAGAAAPLPNTYPYPRFDERSPNPSQPSKAMLDPDGFVVGLFGTISKGSFSTLGQPKSFAMLHAGLLDELYLNRLKLGKDMTLRTRSSALEASKQNGFWEAPNNLRDAEGQPVASRPGENLILVRVGIKKGALQDAGKFSLSQVRLICRPKGADAQPLAGRGQAVYPIGYIGAGGRLDLKSLSEEVTIQSGSVPGNAKNIDFAFYVPTHLTPALIGFKGNNLQQISALASDEDAPQPVGLEGTAQPAQEQPPEPAVGPDRPSSSRGRRNGSGLSNVGTVLTGGALEEDMQP
jgi:hypothetical protein